MEQPIAQEASVHGDMQHDNWQMTQSATIIFSDFFSLTYPTVILINHPITTDICMVPQTGVVHGTKYEENIFRVWKDISHKSITAPKKIRLPMAHVKCW